VRFLVCKKGRLGGAIKVSLRRNYALHRYSAIIFFFFYNSANIGDPGS
jgi:hypothetical protein